VAQLGLKTQLILKYFDQLMRVMKI